MSPFNQPKPWEKSQTPGTLPRRSMLDSDNEMDITPMIDITFLLLIFFIVASKMDTGTEVTLPLAKHGIAVTLKDSIVITMLGGEKDTEVYFGEGDAMRKIDAIDQVVQEELIIGRVEEAVNAQPPLTQVIIRADKATKHREVSRILRAVGRVESVSAYVAVLEEQ